MIRGASPSQCDSAVMTDKTASRLSELKALSKTTSSILLMQSADKQRSYWAASAALFADIAPSDLSSWLPAMLFPAFEAKMDAAHSLYQRLLNEKRLHLGEVHAAIF